MQGELRSGYRANMLMGVTSNRVDVKRAAAAAERELERRAEPLSALYLPASEYPTSLLGLAWREMVRNSAHDSICACSVDDVVDAVLHRYAEAREIGAGLAERALKAFARSLSVPGPTVVNLSARTRSGVVELVVPAEGPASADVQVLSERTGMPGSMVLDADTVRTVLGMMQGPRISDDAWIHEVKVEDTDEGMDITISVGPEEKAGRAHRRGQAGRVHQAGGPARLRGAGGHGPTFDATHRGPFGRGGRVRVGRLHAGGAGASGDGGRRSAVRCRCPTASSPSRSTAPTAPSRSTACPATGAWSTRATWATRTTTRRPGRTR